MELKELISQAQELELKILKENSDRKKIKESEQYQEISQKIKELSEAQEAMMWIVEDSTQDLIEVKKKILEKFKEKGLKEYENAKGKFKTKKSVNSEKLLSILGGDIDTFVVLSEVSQKKLKEYAKDNKDIKKSLLGCIQEDSKELVDITIKYE